VSDPVAGDEDGPGLDRVFDGGLQHERTALAWDRTGLSLLVVGALLLRSGGPPYGDVVHLPGYVGLSAGAILLWAGGRRYRRREVRLREGLSMVQPRLVVLAAVAALTMGVASLFVILLS
jgi:uncharacterized membrane protein YidH (DUF202 family)